LERTMIVGSPTAKQERNFGVMLEAQETGFGAMKARNSCAEVDRATIDVFKKAGLMSLTRHHSGHGLGLEMHEPPWLDIGNEEPLRNGMIVSCEPGIYEVGFAGFRHSDTVLINEDKADLLTYYPRDLSSLIIS